MSQRKERLDSTACSQVVPDAQVRRAELGEGSGDSENVDEVRRGVHLAAVSLSYSWREYVIFAR